MIQINSLSGRHKKITGHSILVRSGLNRKYKIFMIVAILAFLLCGKVFAQWTVLSSGTSSYMYSVYFPGTSTGYATGISGIILKTTNGGNNWTNSSPYSVSYLFSVYFVSNTTGIAVGSGGKILRTVNGGSWDTVHSGSTQNIRSVCFLNSTTGFAVGDVNTIIKTTNAGATWSPSFLDNQLGTDNYFSICFIDANTGWVCGNQSPFAEIRKTTNGGAIWSIQTMGSYQHNLSSIKFYNSNEGIAVGDSGFVLKTSNGGTNWVTSSSGITANLQSVDVGVNPNSSIHSWFAVGYSGKIIKSTNGGSNWVEQSSGVTFNLTEVNCLSHDTAYVVGGQGTILRTYDGGVIPTAIQNNGGAVPEKFNLYQNYPNPFNPSTTIKFDVSENTAVEISIYDITGRLAETLLKRELAAGSYDINWNASNYPSGVYFYEIRTRDFADTKRMVLVK